MPLISGLTLTRYLDPVANPDGLGVPKEVTDDFALFGVCEELWLGHGEDWGWWGQRGEDEECRFRGNQVDIDQSSTNQL